MANYLILGGAGFIGSKLSKRLVSEGHNVVVVDKMIEQVHGSSKSDLEELPLIFIKADCTTADWITPEVESFSPFDCVFHLVSETGTAQSMYQASQQTRSNIESLALLNDVLGGSESAVGFSGHSGQAAKLQRSNRRLSRLAAKRLILASSRAVYGDAGLDSQGDPIASREEDRPNPKSIYAVTKLAQELMLFVGFANIETCALRFQNVYGEGQSLGNPYTGVASVFTQAALSDEDIVLFSDGEMQRDFVHVDDAVEAICIAVNSQASPFEVMNVGSGGPTSLLDLAKLIVKLSGSKSRILISGESLSGDVRANYADISRISSMGYRASVQLEQGLERLVAWARVNNSEDNSRRYRESLLELRSRGILS
jgi:dTDP-L-rhamnose 4-epimerase